VGLLYAIGVPYKIPIVVFVVELINGQYGQYGQYGQFINGLQTIPIKIPHLETIATIAEEVPVKRSVSKENPEQLPPAAMVTTIPPILSVINIPIIKKEQHCICTHRFRNSCNNCVSNQEYRPPANLLCISHNSEIRYPLSEHLRVQFHMFNEEYIAGSIVRNYYTPRRPLKDFIVSKGAEKIYKEPNAGGSSVNSEALSADLFDTLFNAKNIITEMEIDYEDMNWKKCDYLMEISNETFGVSVTRAMKHPSPDLYDYEDAELLLSRKLSGLIVARSGILHEDYNFTKSILHIWCQTPKIADIITDVYNRMDDMARDNIIVMLTISSSDYIYYDKLDKSLHKKFQVVTESE
jgi:hypothetical protein